MDKSASLVIPLVDFSRETAHQYAGKSSVDRCSLRSQIARTFMILGLGTLVFTGICAFLGREPFHTWFFLFAWWSYLFFIDGWVYRHRSESLILRHPRRFLFFSCLSVALWFLFEAFNLRLENWSYANLPEHTGLRWMGYILAFATVLPGLMETADLLDTAGFLKGWHVRPLGRRQPVAGVFLVVGIVMVVLPLLWPTLFFPLIWGAFFFLLEPLNERLGAPSVLADWRTGTLRRAGLLLLSGFLCGVFWEWWNSFSGARWTYSVPGLEDVRIFEMPVLGYLGFPPFALEVFAGSALAVTLWEKSPRSVRALLVLGLTVFSLGMCWVLDRFTVAP